MKTTKNYFNYLFIALTLVFSISLSSCSDDDENVGSKNDLIGTWQSIHSEGYITYTEYPEDNEEWNEDYKNGETTTFYQDYTFKENSEEGTWSLSGNKLTMNYKGYYEGEDWTEVWKILELNTNTFVFELHEKDSEGDFYTKETLKKISD